MDILEKQKELSLKNLSPELKFIYNRIILFNSILINYDDSNFKDNLKKQIKTLYQVCQNIS